MVFYRRETYIELREMAFFGALFSLVVLITRGTVRSSSPAGPSWCRFPSRPFW